MRSDLERNLALVGFDFPREYLHADRTPNWEAIYLRLGLHTVEDVRTVILGLMLVDLEVAVAVHRALAQIAFDPDRDRRHLPMFEEPPLDESAWLTGDLVCVSCPGDVPIAPGVPLCTCADRVSKWSNCLAYREALRGARIAPEEGDPT